MMSATPNLVTETGSACNRVSIGGETILFGDKQRAIEKPHTIVYFPGGHIEIARTSDDLYWVHVAVRESSDRLPGRIIDARIDHVGRYNDGGNVALREAIQAGDLSHVALLMQPGGVR